jgi:hypothetical protein
MKKKVTILVLNADEKITYCRDFHTQREAIDWVMKCGLDEEFYERFFDPEIPGWAVRNAHKIDLTVDYKFRRGWTSLPWNQSHLAGQR